MVASASSILGRRVDRAMYKSRSPVTQGALRLISKVAAHNLRRQGALSANEAGGKNSHHMESAVHPDRMSHSSQNTEGVVLEWNLFCSMRRGFSHILNYLDSRPVFEGAGASCLGQFEKVQSQWLIFQFLQFLRRRIRRRICALDP